MKQIITTAFLLAFTLIHLQAQQIYDIYRQMPEEKSAKELAITLAQAGNITNIDSIVQVTSKQLLEQNDLESYAFITNEYLIHLYYRGQFRTYDKVLSDTYPNISQLEENNFERLLHEHFQTLMHRIKGEIKEAAEDLTKIKTKTKNSPYANFYKNCCTDYCTVNLQIGNYNKAFAVAQEIKELSTPISKNNNHLDIAALYTNLGYALLSIDPKLANQYLFKAVDLFENTNDTHGQLSYRTMAMGALGRSYNMLKEHDKAIDINQRRLKLANDSIATGKLPLTSLGEVYMDIYYTYFEDKQYDQMKNIAQEYYKFCESYSTQLQTRQKSACDRLLGYAYTMNGDPDSGLVFIKASLDKESQLYEDPYASPMQQTYLYLADSHFKRKEYKKAEKAYLNALRCMMENDSILTLNNLSSIPRQNIYNAKNCLLHLQEVLFVAYTADNNTQHLYDLLNYSAINEELLRRNHQLSQNESVGLAYSKELKHNKLFALKATERLANTHQLPQYADSAFALAEKTKLFHLRNNKAIAAVIKTIPDSILGNYNSIKDSLEQNANTLSMEQAFKLNNDLFLSRLKLDPYFAEANTNTQQEINTQNCPANQSYISYTIYDDTIFIAAFNNKESCIKRIVAPELRKNTQQLIRQIKTGGDYSDIQKQLSQTLIAPVSHIMAQHPYLTIIPDNYLFRLPFELLVHNKQLMIENYNVNYQYAYSNTNTQKPQNYSLLAISPFAKDELPLSEDLAQVVRGYLDQESLRDDHLVMLPYSGKEVKNIAKIFEDKGLNTSTLYGPNANKENLLKTLPNSTILHFATHGTSSNNKDATGLFLAENDKTSNFLSLNELYHLELSGELAVLSACKSGMGNIQEGEGILSLPRGFIYAGIPNIVASLWKVHDKKTKTFMEEFYKQLIKENKNYSEALREAKLLCIKKGYLPMDWAGFVLISD